MVTRPAVLVATLAAAALVVAPPAAGAARTRHHRPVLRLVLSRTALPASGGAVVLHLSVRGATRCRFSAPAPVRVPKGWRSCRRPSLRAVARVRPSKAPVPLRRHVTAWAVGPGGRSAAVRFFVQGPAGARRTPEPAAAATPSANGTLPTLPPLKAAPSSPATPQGAPKPLAVTTSTLPDATVGLAYAASLGAQGGTAPYRWSISGGALPAGLSLSPTGTITGVPAAPGTTGVTVTVTDASSPSPEHATVALALAVVGPPSSDQASANWSGYVVPSPGPLITETSGEWTVPNLDCAQAPNGGLATWVGIGGARATAGASSGVLLQTGVTSECLAGFQTDLGWWEEYPSTPNNEIDFSGLRISPGDLLQATVYESTAGAWATRLDDITTGISGVMVTGQGWGVSLDGSGTFSDEGSTASLSYAGGTSAEWIVEDYQRSNALVPLADYGTITFASLTTSLASWTLSPAEAVEMVQGGSVLSTPSAPAANGFSVTATSG